MSLTPIVETVLMVALLFIAAGTTSARWERGPRGGGGMGPARSTSPLAWGAALHAVWPPAAAEALLLTLLAALWFGSLGHGGWLTVFLLVGALATGAERWRGHRLLATPVRQELLLFAVGLARYALAGWLCAWRLS